MKLHINGDEREVEIGTTVGGFLESKGLRPEMVVVEYNGEILPRDKYSTIVLAEGDNLEVVQMMAGG